MHRSTNSKHEPNIHTVRQSMRVTFNHITYCPKCPYPKKINVKRFNAFIECNDGTKITRIRSARYSGEAWYCEACNANHVCADATAAKRHMQRHHNAPNSKIKIPRNESTSIDVEAEFLNDVCFNNLVDNMNSLNFVNVMNEVPKSDKNFI